MGTIPKLQDMAKAFSLEEVIPEDPEFFVASKNKSYTVRPPNMLDQVWFKERYGDTDKMQKAMADLDWVEISRIIYHQLSAEDRKDFPATVAEYPNDDGDIVQQRISGPEHLLVSLAGLEECLKMLSALTRAIMNSNPLAGEAIAAEVKKSLKSFSQPATPKSSSNSTMPSAGRKNTSRR